jgi:aldose 1-epimerase
MGLVVKLTNFGARIVSVLMPDTAGSYSDITLGYRNIKDYVNDNMFLGCVVGRYANRIANGKFSIDGKKYQLFINDGPNSLHGGKKGLNRVVWDGLQNGNEVTFHYYSPDMEEGYPGNLDITVRYFLTDTNSLGIEYEASTDKKTVINLTNHAYFNLQGEGSGDIFGQFMYINADNFLPVNETLIPTGKLEPVENSAMDFRTAHKIGDSIMSSNLQVIAGKGYDHCWILNKTSKDGAISLAATVVDTVSGRGMQLWTTEPGVQFYSGNFMDGKVTGKAGLKYNYRNAFAMEPEHYPDSPNQPNFPTTILNPGEKYHQLSMFYFFTAE